MSEAKNTASTDAPCSSVCSAADLATRVIEQWDNYDKFRATEADKALWDGDEPNDVAIARDLILSRNGLAKMISDVGGILDLAGSHYLEWDAARFAEGEVAEGRASGFWVFKEAAV